MNKHPLLAGFLAEIWAIKPDFLEAFLARVGAIHPQALFGTPSTEAPGLLSISGDTAKIEIKGPILRSGVPILRFFGVNHTGLDELNAAISEVSGRADITRVDLEVDSPGGVVSGTPETAARIRDLPQEVTARTSGTMASAAYWLASGADRIEVTPTAAVGSIGVISVIADSSEAAAQEGVKIHAVTSGPLKGLGVPGTEVTPDHLAEVQRIVDQTAAMFVADISEARGFDAQSVATGQVWLGAEAVEKGLADFVSGKPVDTDNPSETPAVAVASEETERGSTMTPEELQKALEAEKAKAEALEADKKALEAEARAKDAALAASLEAQRGAMVRQYADRVVPAMAEAVAEYGAACGSDLAKFEAFLKALPVQVRSEAQGANPTQAQAPSPQASDEKQGILRALRALGCVNLQSAVKYADVVQAYSDGTLVLADGTITNRDEVEG